MNKQHMKLNEKKKTSFTQENNPLYAEDRRRSKRYRF